MAKNDDVTLGQISPTGEVEKPVSMKDYQRSLGGSGTRLFNGYLDEEQNTKLKGQQGSKIYDEMRNTDAQVNASLLVMELPIRNTRRYVEPGFNQNGETQDIDKEIADFVEENLFNIMEPGREDFLREVLTMLCFGFSVFEKTYRVKDGKVVIDKLGYRKQTSIEKWEQKDGTPGITQQLDAPLEFGENKGESSISIPSQKLLIFSHRREGDNYEGKSALRSAYKHWKFKDSFYRFDSIRHERQGVGIPVVTLPDNATAGDKEWAFEIAQNIRATEKTGIVLPGQNRKFEFADLRAGDNTGFIESIDHHNREIVKNVLAQFLELGNTASGSRSLGDSQTSLFLTSLGSIAKYIADVLNKYLIKELVDMNYDGVTDYPKLVFESLEEGDKNLAVDSINKLVMTGILPIEPVLQDYIRDLLGLPPTEVKLEPGTVVPPLRSTAGVNPMEQPVGLKEHDHSHKFFDQGQDLFFVKQKENNNFIKHIQIYG